MLNNDLKSISYGRGYVYNLKYHIVWCTKHRKKILCDGVDEKLLSVIDEICSELGIAVLAKECMPDHIHLLIDCTPQHFIPTIIKILKGGTGKQIFGEFPDLKNELHNGHLWNPTYFVSTVSETTEQQISDYINSQKTSTRAYIKRPYIPKAIN